MIGAELQRVGEENVKEYTLKLVVVDDPAAVYAEDILAHLRRKEVAHAIGAVCAGSDVTRAIRRIIIDWLVDLHAEFRLQEETLYMTIDVFDRFLATRVVSRAQAQLVSMAAFLIACKYEEIQCPSIHDIAFLSAGAYSVAQIRDMESIVLNALHFEVCNVTVVSFLQHGDKAQHYFAQTALLNENTALPSQLAAACIYLATGQGESTPLALAIAALAQLESSVRRKFKKQCPAFLDEPLPKC